ncbi:extracellular solute-binding protein [Proteiniborus sp.]|uniref:ABC transporter substrate-binding protein n=1 Tax=Proteiniborus sp. TaxID=2079015 RepID=UPI00331A4B5B
MGYKKVLIILLTLSLMFVFYGCTKENKTTDVAKDIKTYKEVILSEALEVENILDVCLNNNNDLVLSIIGKDSRKYVVLDENGDVNKEINTDFSGRPNIFTFDKNNNMYILADKPELNENREITSISKKLLFYDNESDSITEDNVIGQLNDTAARSIEDTTRKIKVDSKGNIYALKLGGSIEVFDSNLNIKKVLDSTPYWDIEMDEEDNLLALKYGRDENKLDKIDTNSYKTIWSKEYSYTDGPNKIYYNKNTKNLYGINAGWVAKYDSKGDLTSRILNTGELSDIDMILDFMVDNSEEIYLTADSQDGYKLIKYIESNSETVANTGVEDEKTEIIVELTRDYDNLFTKAAKRFGEINPDIKVTVNLYPDLDEYQYSDKLNTEIMAGKGPDILYLRPWNFIRTYIEKGILVNLDEVIEKDNEFNIEGYNTHIIDNSRYNDELYTMPINYYQFYTFVLNEKLLEEKGITLDDNLTWKDVYALSEKLNENSNEQIYVLPKMDDWSLNELILMQDIDHYLDLDKKEAKFNTEEFIEALELMKSIKEDNIMHPDLLWYEIMNATNYGEIKDLSNIAIYLGQTHSYAYIQGLGSFYDGFTAVSAPKGEYTGDRLYYSDYLAINSNSQHKEEVWEFIKFIITEEAQTFDDRIIQGTFRINNNASQKQIDGMFEYQNKYPDQMEKDKSYFANEEDIDELNRIIGNLNKPKTSEPIYDVIQEEVNRFLSGEKSAEEVAEQLQNKADIYLHE